MTSGRQSSQSPSFQLLTKRNEGSGDENDANQGTMINWTMRTKIRANTDFKNNISSVYESNKKHQSTAKCKSGLVTKNRFSDQLLTNNKQRKKDNKFSQLKVLFKYLLV